MTDQPGSPDEPEPSSQPPSWSPIQPPPSGGAYAVPPGQSAPPPPPPPAYGAPPPAYGAPPPGYGPTPPPGPQPYPAQPYPYPATPGYAAAGYGQPGFSGYGYAAPKPGIIPLRPLVFSEILDGAVQALRSNPRMVLWSAIGLIGILIIFGGLIGVSLALSSAAGNDTTLSVVGQLATSAAEIAAELIAVAAQTFIAGLVIVSVSEAVLGRKATFKEVWARVRPRFWRLIGYTLVSSVAIFVGFACCILPGLALEAIWVAGAPALILERTGVFAAFGRSRALISGSFWRVVGILLVVAILGEIVTFMVAGVFAGVGALVGLFFGTTGAIVGAIVLGGIGLVSIGTITSTFSASVTALIYIDQRMRREGLDIALARASGSVPAA